MPTAQIIVAGSRLFTTSSGLMQWGAQWDIPKQGLTWTNAPNITWGWATSATTSGLGTLSNQVTDATQQSQIENGISLWAQVSGVKLSQVAASQANIQIGYSTSISGLTGQAVWSYSGTNFIQAVAWLADPSGGSPAPLTTDGSGWLSYSNGVELRQVACHEFGVNLGLAEGNQDPSSVLNHVLGSQNRVPDVSDAVAMQSIYGPPS